MNKKNFGLKFSFRIASYCSPNKFPLIKSIRPRNYLKHQNTLLRLFSNNKVNKFRSRSHKVFLMQIMEFGRKFCGSY